MIRIDGNYLEGGGQIVRTALALSALTNQPFEMGDIRKGRREPGIKHQHLFCIRDSKQLCNAKVDGGHIGSDFLKFIPGKKKKKNLDIDIGTAGSITLLLQSLLLPCFFADKKIKIRIKGGTDTRWSMPFDYFQNILVPRIENFADIEVKLIRRGYYPKGQGEVEIRITPSYQLNSFKGFYGLLGYLRKENKQMVLAKIKKPTSIQGVSHASRMLEKAEVAERQAKSARINLSSLGIPLRITSEYNNAACPGSGIALWTNTRIGAGSLGEKGKKAELVGKEAAEILEKELNGAVDSHLADNLIPWLALFGGKITATEITPHTLTNIYAAEKFLGKTFKVEKYKGIVETINI